MTSKRLEISELVGGSTVLDLLIVELRLLFVLWRPVGNLFEAVVKSSFSAGSALLSPSLGITVTTVVEAKVVVLVVSDDDGNLLRQNIPDLAASATSCSSEAVAEAAGGGNSS